MPEPLDRRRRAEDRIFRAWYAALISGVLSLLLALFASGAGPAREPISRLVIADALLTIGLGWLVLRKSRVAAGLLSLRSVGAAVGYASIGYYLNATITVGLFGIFYVYGLLGIIELRRLHATVPPGQSASQSAAVN